MKRLGLSLLIILILITTPQWAISAPKNIKVVPRSGTVIDLFWQGQFNEAYDIWQSTDGTVWTNIYTTDSAQESYTVTEGIEPYVNYYYLISTKDTVTDPSMDATVSNATYVGPAYPPNQSAHYFYTNDTNLCADCHSTHTGVGEALLKYQEVDALCLTCHDGSQSKYNVLDGVVSRDGTWNNPLQSAAGAFGALSGHTSNVIAESLHTLGAFPSEAPGGNPEALGDGLSCISCHSAHNTQNYRIITKSTPENTNVGVIGYAVTDKVNDREYGNYISGINDLCSGCHPDYLASAGSGHEPASETYVTDGKYRHPVGVSPAVYGLTTTLPLEGINGDNSDKVFCLTCHYAHGSTKETALSEINDTDGETAAVNYNLRRDYWAVCQDCHKK